MQSLSLNSESEQPSIFNGSIESNTDSISNKNTKMEPLDLNNEKVLLAELEDARLVSHMLNRRKNKNTEVDKTVISHSEAKKAIMYHQRALTQTRDKIDELFMKMKISTEDAFASVKRMSNPDDYTVSETLEIAKRCAYLNQESVYQLESIRNELILLNSKKNIFTGHILNALNEYEKN